MAQPLFTLQDLHNVLPNFDLKEVAMLSCLPVFAAVKLTLEDMLQLVVWDKLRVGLSQRNPVNEQRLLFKIRPGVTAWMPHAPAVASLTLVNGQYLVLPTTGSDAFQDVAKDVTINELPDTLMVCLTVELSSVLEYVRSRTQPSA